MSIYEGSVRMAFDPPLASPSPSREFQFAVPAQPKRPKTSQVAFERKDCLSDDVALGRLRAFDAFHRHHRAALERESKKFWVEQERLRMWKVRNARHRIQAHTKERDRGVLEAIVSKRNSEKKAAAAENREAHLGRPALPLEDRAVYAEASQHVYFWG